DSFRDPLAEAVRADIHAPRGATSPPALDAAGAVAALALGDLFVLGKHDDGVVLDAAEVDTGCTKCALDVEGELLHLFFQHALEACLLGGSRVGTGGGSLVGTGGAAVSQGA